MFQDRISQLLDHIQHLEWAYSENLISEFELNRSIELKKMELEIYGYDLAAVSY